MNTLLRIFSCVSAITGLIVLIGADDPARAIYFTALAILLKIWSDK